ncbi:MAG: surface carbohydrate biosynthesis protein [bacterium]|jgi:surface carbohydrate biosynthesis protein
MKNIRPIFIPYETKSREFDGKILLITHLMNSGFENIFFGSRGATKREAIKHEDGIYIFKSLSEGDIPFYKLLKERNFIIVLLHAEGGIHYKENKDSIISTYPKSIFKYVDLNFVFGQKIKDDIYKYIGKEIGDKTIVSGDPRFDLLKINYRNFFDRKNKELTIKYKDFILVNTSFSAANPEIGKEGLLNVFINEKTYSEGAQKKLRKKMNFFDGVLKDYLVALKECANSFIKMNFVIRPHPSESLQTYLDYFKDVQNVYVVKEGNVADWILASIGVIHYDCTTGLEALIAQKPVIAFVPRIDEEIVAWLPIYMSKRVDSISGLKENINEIVNSNFEDSLYKEKVPEFKAVMNNVDETSSGIIIKEFKDSEVLQMEPFILYKNSFIMLNFKNHLKLTLNKLGLRKERKSNYLKKFESCINSEVSEKISIFREIENFDFDFSILQCGPEMVYLNLK